MDYANYSSSLDAAHNPQSNNHNHNNLPTSSSSSSTNSVLLSHPDQQQQQKTQSGGSLPLQQPVARKLSGRYALADFGIERTLGTGSFGRVHLVRSRHNLRFYAIKVSVNVVEVEEEIERMLR